MYGRWKKAVIHLEGAANSQTFTDRMRIREALESGTISQAEYQEITIKGMRANRYQGTALYIADGARRYLVTARHVLFDENAANNYLKQTENNLGNVPGISEHDIKYAEDTIFQIIFRVPSLMEPDDHSFGARSSMMNLRAGPIDTLPYSFSSPNIDLAVISLTSADRPHVEGFDRFLQERGHVPIPYAHIGNEPSEEGADIFTVGYPADTALLKKRELHPALTNWESSFVSIPTFAFGKVAMLHPALDYFGADMSIFSGNSGGPIVEKDRLVGVVLSVSTSVIDGTEHRVTLPYSQIAKARDVKRLIEIQKAKDEQAYARSF